MDNTPTGIDAELRHTLPDLASYKITRDWLIGKPVYRPDLIDAVQEEIRAAIDTAVDHEKAGDAEAAAKFRQFAMYMALARIALRTPEGNLPEQHQMEKLLDKNSRMQREFERCEAEDDAEG